MVTRSKILEFQRLLLFSLWWQRRFWSNDRWPLFRLDFWRRF
jgi:hypothetical protein